MLEKLEKIMSAIIPILIPAMTFTYNALKDHDNKILSRLYYKIENDFFYAVFLTLEVVNLFLGCLIAVFTAYFISIFNHGLNIHGNITYLFGFTISFVSSCFLLKLKWVRKRALGDKKGKIFLIVSVVLFHLIYIFNKFDKTYLEGIFTFVYLVLEIISLFHFRGRYVKYRFSKVKFYLDDGSKVLCENIEKLRGKRNYIIVDNEENAVVIPYNKIQKAEYFGPPKIILISNKKKRVKKREKR